MDHRNLIHRLAFKKNLLIQTTLLYLSEITLSIQHTLTIHLLVMDICKLIFQPILNV